MFIDIGDVTQYAEAYMTITAPGAWQISPGMAEMGWASSGVLGRRRRRPRRPAIALVGDGAFNMDVAGGRDRGRVRPAGDLGDAQQLRARHRAQRHGARLFSASHPWCHFRRKDTGERYNPDYVALARAYGAEGVRDRRSGRTGAARSSKALASRRPWVIDVPIDLSVGSYFTKGIDRAYPSKWAKSYPSYNLLRNAEG